VPELEHTREYISLREYEKTLWDAHAREHVLLNKALDKAEAEMNRRLE